MNNSIHDQQLEMELPGNASSTELNEAISYLEWLEPEAIPPKFQERLLKLSNKIARAQMKRGITISSPANSRDAIRDLLQLKQEELMAVLFLDSKHRLIAYEELFHWSISSATIHVRVMVKRALAHNASAMIIAHNHPSWVCDPSSADKAITETITLALGMIEVKLLDHFVVSTEGIFSFAESGAI